MHFDWFGEQYLSDLEKHFQKQLKAAAIYLVSKIREKIDVAQEVAGKGVRRRGLDPSKPNEPPKRVLGRLLRSISWEFTGDFTAGVGTSLLYGLFLELGTVWTAARPYIRSTLLEEEAKIAEILSAPLP